MQELGKLNLEVNVTPNGLEKYASFSINNKSKNFVDSFQRLISPLDSLVKNLNQDILTIWAKNLIKTRIWSSYTKKVTKNILKILKSLKNNYLAKNSFRVCQRIKKFSDKSYDTLKVWNKFEMK